MKIISVVTFKGGAAKTTTAVNFSHILATEHGNRVLIVDNDAEANTTVFFKKTGAELSIADVLSGDASIRDAIVPTGFDRLDLLPADGGLHIFNREIAAIMGCDAKPSLEELIIALATKCKLNGKTN